MLYNKQFLIFKEINKGYSLNGKAVSGIFKVECQDGETAVSLSLIGFSALTEGKYFAAISLDGDKFSYDLGSNPIAFSRVEKVKTNGENCSCLIAHVADEITPVAIAASDNSGTSAIKLAEHLDCEIKNEKTTQTPSAKETDFQVQTPAYDDETVATENYYLFDNKEAKNEYDLPEKDVAVNDEGKNEKSREEKDFEMFKNETGFTIDEKNDFSKIKENLENVFATYPEDFSLQKSLPNSKWVKIECSVDKHYLVGGIYKNSEPEYVCYAVPAKYGETPPEELKEICCFIPLSIFDMQGDGYFVIFQSTATGKCVHIQKDE